MPARPGAGTIAGMSEDEGTHRQRGAGRETRGGRGIQGKANRGSRRRAGRPSRGRDDQFTGRGRLLAGRSDSRGDESRSEGRDLRHRLDTARGVESRRLPPGLEPAGDEPELPEGYDDAGLPNGVRTELRGLSRQLATRVGGHLQAVGELIDLDPELALRHARVARRLAPRLPVVRETVAETAYLAEDYPTALTEFRALHRLTGNDEYLPVIADCERAVGKPQHALRTLRGARQARLSPTQQIEVILVEAGVRADLGQQAEACRLLTDAIASRRGGRRGQARLRYASAEALFTAGQTDTARRWFESAATHDAGGELDCARRIAELAGSPLPAEEIDDEFEIMGVEIIDLADAEPESAAHQKAGRESAADDPIPEDPVQSNGAAPGGLVDRALRGH